MKVSTKVKVIVVSALIGGMLGFAITMWLLVGLG